MPRAAVPMAPEKGASMVVKVYEASWAATRGLSRTLKDSTANSSARCMGGPPSGQEDRVGIHRRRGVNLSNSAEKVQDNRYLWAVSPVRSSRGFPPRGFSSSLQALRSRGALDPDTPVYRLPVLVDMGLPCRGSLVRDVEEMLNDFSPLGAAGVIAGKFTVSREPSADHAFLP